jgi:thiol-disulfide isomerase/thioredoxin
MMKKIIAVAIATTALLYACSPKNSATKNGTGNKISVDNSGKPMLIGACDPSSLKKAPFKDWFEKNYSDYKVNDTITKKINPLVSDKTFLLFMGTWCGDSKREVPRMLKILKASNVSKSQVKLVMVDNHDSTYKQSPQHEEAGLNLHRVPTLIVYQNQQEIGRIVESPVFSIEKDLFAILNGDNYKPNYKAVIYLDSLFRNIPPAEIENKINDIATALKPIVKNAAELNTYGYVLMAAKKSGNAGIVFKMNVLLYPKNANAFDSLGEYYFNTGKMDLAKENYKQVLLLDPKNENAKKMLEKIGR